MDLLEAIGLVLGWTATGFAIYCVDRAVAKQLSGRGHPQRERAMPLSYWWILVWAMALGAVVGNVQLVVHREWERAALFVPVTALTLLAAVWAFKRRFFVRDR